MFFVWRSRRNTERTAGRSSPLCHDARRVTSLRALPKLRRLVSREQFCLARQVAMSEFDYKFQGILLALRFSTIYIFIYRQETVLFTAPVTLEGTSRQCCRRWDTRTLGCGSSTLKLHGETSVDQKTSYDLKEERGPASQRWHEE